MVMAMTAPPIIDLDSMGSLLELAHRACAGCECTQASVMAHEFPRAPKHVLRERQAQGGRKGGVPVCESKLWLAINGSGCPKSGASTTSGNMMPYRLKHLAAQPAAAWQLLFMGAMGMPS